MLHIHRNNETHACYYDFQVIRDKFFHSVLIIVVIEVDKDLMISTIALESFMQNNKATKIRTTYETVITCLILISLIFIPPRVCLRYGRGNNHVECHATAI